MQDTMRQLTHLATQCAVTRMSPLSQAELLEFLADVHTAQQVLQAAVLHAVRAVEQRGIPAEQQAPSAQAWLRSRLRISAKGALQLLEQADALDRDPALDAAVTAGTVNAEQLAAIIATLAQLPKSVGPEVRSRAGAVLTDWAPRLDPGELRTAGRRILDHAAPEVAEAKEERWLRRSEQEAHEQRFLTLSPIGDGRVRVRGLLDSEAAAIVTAALDPLCKPDPARSRAASPKMSAVSPGGLARGAAESDATEAVGITPGTIQPAAIQPATIPPATIQPSAAAIELAETGKARTPGQRRADAFIEVCRAVLAGGKLPENGGDRPQVTVTASYDVLRKSLGAGLLDTGEPVSAEAVRRMACDARILPVVLDGKGKVLDVGRTRRLATGSIRRALTARDRGCVFPGCDRPARWCDAHHIVSWADDGPTDVSNLALLCGYHHRVVHEGTGWEIHIADDGHPAFLPPVWLDPARLPRRNQYHRRI